MRPGPMIRSLPSGVGDSANPALSAGAQARPMVSTVSRPPAVVVEVELLVPVGVERHPALLHEHAGVVPGAAEWLNRVKSPCTSLLLQVT